MKWLQLVVKKKTERFVGFNEIKSRLNILSRKVRKKVKFNKWANGQNNSKFFNDKYAHIPHKQKIPKNLMKCIKNKLN